MADNKGTDKPEPNMTMPTLTQQTEVLAEHVLSVGALHVNAYEIALALDARYPGMTQDEFMQLQVNLGPDIEAARAEALHSMWADA